MNKHETLLLKILLGRADANIPFQGMCNLLLYLGFEERTHGSHHCFRKAGIEDKLVLQEDGAQAKPYQVRQVRRVILKYRLGETTES